MGNRRRGEISTSLSKSKSGPRYARNGRIERKGKHAVSWLQCIAYIESAPAGIREAQQVKIAELGMQIASFNFETWAERC
jgi:hypothetical protein